MCAVILGVRFAARFLKPVLVANGVSPDAHVVRMGSKACNVPSVGFFASFSCWYGLPSLCVNGVRWGRLLTPPPRVDMSPEQSLGAAGRFTSGCGEPNPSGGLFLANFVFPGLA